MTHYIADISVGLEFEPNVVYFKILKDGTPVNGANVSLITKDVIPTSFTRTTDASGVASFNVVDITPPEIHEKRAFFENAKWMFLAYSPNSEYGMWKDNVQFKLERQYEYALKKYTTPPTFFLRMELRDTIGAELFSNLVASIQEAALEWAGMTVQRVEGVGTRMITVYFSPPWYEESPFVIEWAAVWFILKVLAVAGAIIAILVVWKWTFGEVAPVVAGLGIIAFLIIALVAAKPVERRAR